MNLTERIKKIEEYFKGMEIISNTVIIKVQYGDKWGAYPSSDESIKVAKSEEVINEWYYYSDYTYTVIDEIFDLIEETIEMNLSAIERLNLFNQKMEELKQLFADESLSKLKTLTFQFIEEKRNKKKKTTKKKEEMNVEPIEVISDVVIEEYNEEKVEVL